MKIEKNEYYVTITADEGKIFADKEGNVVSKMLHLGNIDSPENYDEIDEPETIESYK